MGVVCFSDGGGFIFKWGGAPWGGIGFDGGGVEKIVGWEGVTPHAPSSLWETLIYALKIFLLINLL